MRVYTPKIAALTENKDYFVGMKLLSPFLLALTISFSSYSQSDISVRDQTDSGYTIDWIFQLSPEFKSRHPELARYMPSYDGMKLTIITDKTGAFTGLSNWEEARDAFLKKSKATLGNKDEDGLASHFLQEMYKSREQVEAMLIPEIRLFYGPYGKAYPYRSDSTLVPIPNPLGEDSLYQVLAKKASVDDANKDHCKLELSTSLDMEKVHNGAGQYTSREMMEFDLTKSSGWIRHISYTRKVDMMGAPRQEESTVFTSLH